ncbi:MAG: HlyC/CorC family transporter [Gemmatimonadetes bacterium]|nr:hemolysin family protein [Gemmatimonadota bacterium]NNM05642.1 HlyC/CorC family transporter [Gemmatimonadota bacterium]
MTVVIPVTAALVLLSAFFSGSSTAIFSVGGSRLRTLREEGFKGAEALTDLRSRAGPIQGILLFLAALTSLLAVGLVTGWCAMKWEVPGLLIGLFGSGLGVLLLGELLPRSIAARRSIFVALAVAPLILRIEKLLFPILSPFFRLEAYLARAGGENGSTREEREVREITSIGQREGIVGLEEHELVERAFRLDELTAWDVMTPRVAIFAWQDSLAIEEIVGELGEVPFSRVPVYGESVDDITGILHVREAYLTFIAGRGSATLKSLSREPFFVPRSLPLTRLLKDFQARRIHMGIVADEFGGTDGLVTLEDVLEELVGEIVDETDLPEEPLIRISRNEVIADGALDLREINYSFNVSLPQLEHRSLNGFIIEELGYVPERGESLERQGVRIDVVDATETQVLRARVRKLPSPGRQEES